MPTSKPGKYENFFGPAIQDDLTSMFGGEDEHLRRITADAVASGFPAISISAFDGYVLRFLLRSIRARTAVEIGALAGYSGAWIARSLEPGGRLDSFELTPERAAFARELIRAAAPNTTVDVHAGPALDNLSRVTGPVDFVFIDADKTNYPNYLEWAARHVREGGIVALDNSFAWGTFADRTRYEDPTSDTHGIRLAIEKLASDPRWLPAMIPTNEGLAVALRTGV